LRGAIRIIADTRFAVKCLAAPIFQLACMELLTYRQGWPIFLRVEELSKDN